MQESPSKIDNRLKFFNNAPRGDPADTSFDDELEPFEEGCDRSKPIGIGDTSFEEELKEPEQGVSYSISIMN